MIADVAATLDSPCVKYVHGVRGKGKPDLYIADSEQQCMDVCKSISKCTAFDWVDLGSVTAGLKFYCKIYATKRMVPFENLPEFSIRHYVADRKCLG